MTKRWFLLSVFYVTACLPQPKSDVQKAKAELVVAGRVLHSNETLSGPVAIFIEQEATAEAVAADDGSFAFALEEERLDTLRLKYGLQDSLLHLYFVSENGNPESAVLNVLNIQNRGAMNLGDVQLQIEAPVTGRVMAYGALVAEARVRLGRKEVQTTADGFFTLDLPAESSTPLLVEKKGFVQTRGTWLPSGQERLVELYSDLTPVGSIDAPPMDRTLANPVLSFSYSANGASRWIRFANNPDVLSGNYVAEAPWQDLRQPLQIVANGSEIYYQFADRDQKILGPVMSFTPSIAMD